MDKVAKAGAIIAVALLGCSGENRDSDGSGMIPANGIDKFNVSVVNQANATVIFSLRPKDGDWANVSLLPGQKETFSCGTCDGKFAVLISSGKKVVEHDLWAGVLYAIRADYERGRYDVYVVE